MKKLRLMCAIAVLSSIFAVSARAGDMHAGITGYAGDMSAGITSEQSANTNEASVPASDVCGDISCGVTQAAVAAILSLL